MKSRAAILSALRSVDVPAVELPAKLNDSELYSDLPTGALLDAFSERFKVFGGEARIVASQSEAVTLIESLTADSTRIISQSAGLAGEVLKGSTKLATKVVYDLPGEVRNFGDFEVGICGCDALIARTGSIVLKSGAALSRRITALVPYQIVVASERQLLVSLDAWLDDLSNQGSWSAATLVSGPSRTADIEKVLVLGAHGPKRVTAIVIKSS